MSQLGVNKQNIKSAFDLLDYAQGGKVNVPQIIDNLTKMGYDKTHPELFDLFNSLEEDEMEYNDFLDTISSIMNTTEDDAGLQRMYDLLIYNPNIDEIDFDTLKKISEDTGNPLSDKEIKFALREIGNGKTISIDDFIKFMKEK